MRVAVVSDIHGNCVALDAALAEIQASSVDKVVCLGDTVQGGPQPAETIERLRELQCPVVLGNSDAWLINDETDMVEATSNEQREVRRWTLSRLTASDLAFIRRFQPTVKITLDNSQGLLCFHGSPLSYDDILVPETPKDDWDRLLGPFAPAIMAGGHTHTQQIRRVGEGLFFNPGSIGAAYNRNLPEENLRMDPWAEYAILSYEPRHLGIEFRRALYDPENLIRTIKKSERPLAKKMIDEYRGLSG